MKIIELCTSSGWGGLELYALNISLWFQKQGDECLVVKSPGSMIHKRLQKTDLPMADLKPVFRFFPVVAALKLARIMNDFNVDILHVHWNKDLILAALAKCFTRRKLKLVFIRHMAITRYKNDFYHRFIYRKVDAYLVITKKLMQEATEYLPLAKDKIHLLYHGVPDITLSSEQECATFLEKYQINRSSFRVLLPGRIEHGKGQHVLIEAADYLAKKGIKLNVVLLGHIMDKAYYEQLEKQVESSGLSEQFHYLGFVENPVSIYNCFDVVVLATYAETFGLVLIEAMKCGLPVIGTNAGGVPEIIQDGKTGFLFESGSSQALAICLEKLIKDEELRVSMAKAGKDYADKVFSEEQHHRNLRLILESLR